MPRLADLRPGDMVSYPNGKSGFTWVVLAVEHSTRTFKWAPVPCRLDLMFDGVVPKNGRWSPPHDEKCWNEDLDILIEDYRKHRNRTLILRSAIANQDLI